MLGRRALTTAALTSNVIVHVAATLAGTVTAGANAGLVRPVSQTLAGSITSTATAGHARPVNIALSADASTVASAGVVRSVGASLASGATTSATVGNGVFAVLAASVDAGASAGLIRRTSADLAAGAESSLAASHARAISAQLQAQGQTALVASSGTYVSALLTSGVAAIAQSALGRVVSADLTAAASSALLASHYNPSLIRIYGAVAADWETPRVLAIWEDMIEEGDIIMKDKAMIAGTNAAKVVRLYPDNGDVGGNGITLAGCHSFVARAKRVDGTGPVLTLSAIVEGDPAQGRVRLEHAADAFTPGVYEIQISYKDGADHNHAYPDDGESLRLEVKAAI